MGKSSSVSNFSIERILSLPNRQHKGKESSSTLSTPSHASATTSSVQSAPPSTSSTSSAYVPAYFSAGKQLKLPPLALTAPLPASLAGFNSRIHRSAGNNHHSHNNNGRSRDTSSSVLRSTTMTGNHEHPATSSSQIGTNSSTMLPTTATTTNSVPATTTTKSKNAKKYKCDLCGRGFSRSNTLITHRVLFTHRYILHLKSAKPYENNKNKIQLSSRSSIYFHVAFIILLIC